MYESGQSGMPTREEILRALQRLEEALARYQPKLPPEMDAGDAGLQALHRSLGLMEDEADRLRLLLKAAS